MGKKKKTFEKQQQQVNHGRPRRYYILGMKINPFSGTSWLPRGLGIEVYAVPKPSMHRPFKKNLVKKNFEKKTKTYEMSQSCDRVYLGHLK